MQPISPKYDPYKKIHKDDKQNRSTAASHAAAASIAKASLKPIIDRIKKK